MVWVSYETKARICLNIEELVLIHLTLLRRDFTTGDSWPTYTDILVATRATGSWTKIIETNSYFVPLECDGTARTDALACKR